METSKHEDYSGYGDSQINFWRSDGYHNQQTDEWDYAGSHDYSFSLSDAKSFDGDGETGVYQYTVVDEFEETDHLTTGETGGTACGTDTYDWDVEYETIYGIERESRSSVTTVFEDSVTTLVATSGYGREASSVERHMTADFLWTNAYGWGSSLSTLDAIESTVIEDSSAVVVGLEGGSSTYTRTVEGHSHGTTSGTSSYSSGESYSSSGGWDVDAGPTSVTYTNTWGTPPGTQPGQTPAAPEYAGPSSEDYGELAESIAARSAAAYNDPATRAAAVDGAIAAFCAVDADEQGQGGGAVFAEVSDTSGAEAQSRKSDPPYTVETQDDGTVVVTINADNTIIILYGHGSASLPHTFKFKGKGTAGAFLGCGAGVTNERIPPEHRIPDSPKTKKDVTTGLGGDAETNHHKLMAKLEKGAKKKAKEIANKTGKPVQIIYIFTGEGIMSGIEWLFRWPSPPANTTIQPDPPKPPRK